MAIPTKDELEDMHPRFHGTGHGRPWADFIDWEEEYGGERYLLILTYDDVFERDFYDDLNMAIDYIREMISTANIALVDYDDEVFVFDLEEMKRLPVEADLVVRVGEAVSGDIYGAEAVSIRPHRGFDDWYQDDAWNACIQRLMEEYDIEESDIIEARLLENVSTRFAYYLLVIFRKGDKYYAGPLFGKFGHAPNMRGIRSFSDLKRANAYVYDKEKNKHGRGYEDVARYTNEDMRFYKEELYDSVHGGGVVNALDLLVGDTTYSVPDRYEGGD